MARLPVPGADKNVWGEVLNDYLRTSLGEDGKLVANAVTAASIQDGTITGAKLQDSTIGGAKIQDGTVAAAKLDSSVQATIAAAFPNVTLDKQWIITGPINVASGDVDYIGPAFVTIPSGYSAVITTVRGRISSGTNANVRITQNGTTLTGLGSVTVTTSGVAVTGLSLAIADGDLIAPVVNSTSGSPQNMSLMVSYRLTKV